MAKPAAEPGNARSLLEVLMRAWTTAATMVLLLASRAHGQPAPVTSALGGDDLYALCTQGLGISCFNYVIGVMDATSNLTGLGLLRPIYCLPPQIEQVQAREVVVSYLRDHPEIRHQVAAGAVQSALASAFPCRR